MFHLQCQQPHQYNGEMLYCGEIIEVKTAEEAEALLKKKGLNFAFFKLAPKSKVPAFMLEEGSDVKKAELEAAKAQDEANKERERLAAELKAKDAKDAEAAKAEAEKAKTEKAEKAKK